jgi:hypothetical protein
MNFGSAKHKHVHTSETISIKPVFTNLNSITFVRHMTDIYFTIQVKHNAVVYLTLNFHPIWDSTALNTAA